MTIRIASVAIAIMLVLESSSHGAIHVRKFDRLGLISAQNDLGRAVSPRPNVDDTNSGGYRMPNQNEILVTIAIVLGCIAAVLYCIFIFRDLLRPCIEATEKALEFVVSTLIRPVNVAIHCLKETVYPIKQCAFASVESLDYSLHPWKRTTY